MSCKHFYLTFNPFLNQHYEKGYTQAHEFYDLLKSSIGKDRHSSAYWGKIISKDREAGVQLQDLQKVLSDNQEQGLSTHLFITDFQNLWVGKVKSVTSQIPKDGRTLSFYSDKKVEVWFELSDFFLLEHANQETAKKLSEFYIDNEYSELTVNGLSPFTTAVKYPCIIQDLAEEQFFDELDESECSHLVFKDNPAIIKSTSDMVLKSIHLYLFPEEMYARIPHSAKLEIESAEMDMLESRHHNLRQITFSYIKALEVVLNDLIIHHLKRKGQGSEVFVDPTSSPPKLYFNQARDFYIPLKQFAKNFSLNNLLFFIEKGASQNVPAFRQAFSEHKAFINYCLKELEPQIKNNKLIEIRNSIAHGELQDLTLHDAMAVRNLIMGVGTPGLIHSCYRTFYPDKFKHAAEVVDHKPKLKLVG
jgi:hypothetical protein